jgi:hypothetical protein
LAEGQMLTYQASGEGEPDLLVQVELDPRLVQALDFLLAAESVEELLHAPVSGLPN